jgi:CBS domain-containing protein
LCLISSDFTQHERLFIVISYLPKATVQAAIGGAPLIAMRAAGMDTQPGQVILAVAVLSIILTAPLGAWAISLVGNRVLEEEQRLPILEGEAVSEENIAASIRADEIMERDIITVRETETLSAVFKAFAESEFTICPIIDVHESFQGIICLEYLRPVLAERDEWEWLIAGDVYRSLGIIPSPNSSLADVLCVMNREDLPEIPVVEPETQRVVGLLNRQKIERTITEKWLEMKKTL